MSEKEIFLKAFQLSNSTQLMHIGDDYELDYKAATNLGFKSLIIDHHKKLPINNKEYPCFHDLLVFFFHKSKEEIPNGNLINFNM